MTMQPHEIPAALREMRESNKGIRRKAKVMLAEDRYTELEWCNGALEACGKALPLAEAQQEILVETLELFDDLLCFPYPESVFPRLTEEDWESLKAWCESRGFPVDRLSAEYGRVFREGLASPVKIAQRKLKAATGKGDA